MSSLSVLFFVAFVDMIGLAMIVPILPFFAREFGASATIVGLLISSFSLAQLLVAPAWGRFSDRYGRRPAILAGLIITAAAYIIFAFAHSVELLLLSRLIQGVGGGTIGVVQAYVADAAPPDRRTKSLGWLSAVTSLGAVAGPAFGSLLSSAGGQQAPGLGAATLSCLVALFAWRFLRESRDLRLSGSQGTVSTTTSRSVIGQVLFRWREPASRLIWIYTVAIGAFYGTIQIVPLLLLDRFGVTEHNVWYFITLLGGMGVVVRSLLLGPMVDRLGEARLSRVGLVVLAGGLGLTGIAQDWPTLLLGFVLMPVGTAFIFPCVTGLLSMVVPGPDRGLYMGVQHTFGGVSRVVFPIAAGIVMDRYGVGIPYLIAAALVLATLSLTRKAAADIPLPPVPPLAEQISAADVTSEFPVEPQVHRPSREARG
jgi:multidrug resistance protein